MLHSLRKFKSVTDLRLERKKSRPNLSATDLDIPPVPSLPPVLPMPACLAEPFSLMGPPELPIPAYCGPLAKHCRTDRSGVTSGTPRSSGQKTPPASPQRLSADRQDAKSFKDWKYPCTPRVRVPDSSAPRPPFRFCMPRSPFREPRPAPLPPRRESLRYPHWWRSKQPSPVVVLRPAPPPSPSPSPPARHTPKSSSFYAPPCDRDPALIPLTETPSDNLETIQPQRLFLTNELVQADQWSCSSPSVTANSSPDPCALNAGTIDFSAPRPGFSPPPSSERSLATSATSRSLRSPNPVSPMLAQRSHVGSPVDLEPGPHSSLHKPAKCPRTGAPLRSERKFLQPGTDGGRYPVLASSLDIDRQSKVMSIVLPESEYNNHTPTRKAVTTVPWEDKKDPNHKSALDATLAAIERRGDEHGGLLCGDDSHSRRRIFGRRV